MRALKGDAVAWEVKETAAVTALASLSDRRFGYAVGNGTVGVYEAGQRLWRVKVIVDGQETPIRFLNSVT